MLTIDMSDMVRMANAIDGMSRQIPFLCASSLTKAMLEGRDAENKAMQAAFDRPTPYTLRALQVVPATKHRLQAELRFKEGFGGTPGWKYLGPEVQGGPRRYKGFERALQRAGLLKGGEMVVPSKRIARDGYGNVPGGIYTRILSALGAATDPANNTVRRPKRSNRKRNLDYFVMRGHAKAPDGIYLQKAKWAVPQFLFVKGVSYKARLPYYETARRVLQPAFEKHFLAGLQRVVAEKMGARR